MKSPEADQQPLAQPLASEAGLTANPPGAADPFAALDDLMVVVEALCPIWPPREPFAATGTWLL